MDALGGKERRLSFSYSSPLLSPRRSSFAPSSLSHCFYFFSSLLFSILLLLALSLFSSFPSSRKPPSPFFLKDTPSSVTSSLSTDLFSHQHLSPSSLSSSFCCLDLPVSFLRFFSFQNEDRRGSLSLCESFFSVFRPSDKRRRGERNYQVSSSPCSSLLIPSSPPQAFSPSFFVFANAQETSSLSSSTSLSFSSPPAVVTPESLSTSAVSTPSNSSSSSSSSSSLVGATLGQSDPLPSSSSSSPLSLDSSSSSSSSSSPFSQPPQGQPHHPLPDSSSSSSSSSSLPSALPSLSPTSSSPSASNNALNASFTNVNMLLLAICLLCCFTLGYFIHMNFIPHLPDSAAAMLTGFAFGILARFFGSSPSENSFLHFDPQFFYFVLLPPIVLEAGFCLNKTAFLNNLGAILLLSILGTILSTIMVAEITFYSAHASGLEGPPHELRGFSWAFASLISATDTVATLSVIGSPKFRLGKKGVDLYSILMGESVLNDAVSIALTRSVLQIFFNSEASVAQRASGLDVIADFLSVVVGSLITGIGLGGFCCFCFRHSKLNKLPEYEVAITLLTAYMSFGVSEWFGFSGVVSLFFCGFMLGHFNVHNLSKKSRYSIDTVFKTIALLSEKTVFAYLGVVAAVGVGGRSFNLFFVLISLLSCAGSRVVCVFPMCLISNRFRREDERIDCSQQILMCLAGLRGAVAFALAMTIPCHHDIWRAVCRHNKELLVTTTLILVVITTLGVGSMLEYAAVKLGTVEHREDSSSRLSSSSSSSGSILHSPCEALLSSSTVASRGMRDEEEREEEELERERERAGVYTSDRKALHRVSTNGRPTSPYKHGEGIESPEKEEEDESRRGIERGALGGEEKQKKKREEEEEETYERREGKGFSGGMYYKTANDTYGDSEKNVYTHMERQEEDEEQERSRKDKDRRRGIGAGEEEDLGDLERHGSNEGRAGEEMDERRRRSRRHLSATDETEESDFSSSNTFVRYLYMLDRQYLQRWLGSDREDNSTSTPGTASTRRGSERLRHADLPSYSPDHTPSNSVVYLSRSKVHV
ncbi:sodium hydrogen exchanger 3 protein [Cystoisospora suis]|uniref:Sodium/hydrogen exchanger n=1 Tax=Cystoisospora suis TaxID=483139 RepID=A0A2C6KX05_9APIC|nr:sodium hydrogen exchanger 3 protein [Cystoisospora suis]